MSAAKKKPLFSNAPADFEVARLRIQLAEMTKDRDDYKREYEERGARVNELLKERDKLEEDVSRWQQEANDLRDRLDGWRS